MPVFHFLPFFQFFFSLFFSKSLLLLFANLIFAYHFYIKKNEYTVAKEENLKIDEKIPYKNGTTKIPDFLETTTFMMCL